jgi:hypothetical protein
MGRQNKSVYDQPDDLPQDGRYEFWPQFLKISPSYQLAHELWCGRVTTDQIPSHVQDFDKVLKTYEHFGDVFNRSNRTWWKEVASSLFAPQIAGLNWKVHKVWQLGETVDQNELNSVMNDYCKITRPNLGSPLTLLASIPLDMKYEDILNSLRQAFRHYRGTRRDVPDYQSPKSLYEIHNRRIELSKLDLMLDLVHGIASKNVAVKQYEVGFHVGVNKTLKRVHKDVESLDSEERTRIGVRVNKLLDAALTAAENAARGKFYDPDPSEMHMKEINFQYLKNRPVPPDDDDDLFAA